VRSTFRRERVYQAGQFDKAVVEFEAVLAAEPERISALTKPGVPTTTSAGWTMQLSSIRSAGGRAGRCRHSLNLAAAYVQKNDLTQPWPSTRRR